MFSSIEPTGIRAAGVAIGHYLQLKDTSGAVVAVFAGGGRGESLGGLRSFSYRKRLRTPGATTVRIAGNDDRIRDFLSLDAHLDYQWEFYRNDPLIGSTFVKDHESFHRGEEVDELADGSLSYISRGQGYNILFSSEAIRYAAGSAQARKSGDSATVAYEFIDENIGPNAGVDTNGNTRVRPGLSLAAFLPSGVNWSGGRANENLADVLDELADLTPADYMILGNGPAAFTAVWRNVRWGLDRTTGNPDGNAPLRFSASQGNVATVQSTYNQLNAVTTVYVLGQGRQTQRRVTTVTDATLLGLSPWARRAVARSESNEEDLTYLASKGQQVIDAQRSRRSFSFDVRQTEAVRYGRDWDMGDLVEVEDYLGNVAAMKIVGVTVSVSESGEENITPEFQEE